MKGREHAHRSGAPHGEGLRRSVGRARGAVRNAILVLLAESPMHGYQLIQTVAERSGGRWSPSPGAIYPALHQLEDEGLVRLSRDQGRKRAELTLAGQEYVAQHQISWQDLLQVQTGPDLRSLVGQLADAARVVGRTGDDAQREAAAAILSAAKRDLYLVLAGQTPQ